MMVPAPIELAVSPTTPRSLCAHHTIRSPVRARGSQSDSLMMVPPPIELAGQFDFTPVESRTDTSSALTILFEVPCARGDRRLTRS